MTGDKIAGGIPNPGFGGIGTADEKMMNGGPNRKFLRIYVTA
jgi:hypothetical protein